MFSSHRVLRAIALSAVLSGVIGSLDAYGQSELIPLQQYLELPANRRTPTYPLIRCAGLNLGLLAYGNFPPDTVRNREKSANILKTIAVVVRSRANEGAIYAVSQDVMDSVNRISNLYEQRARDNYARKGEAFGSDQVIKGDLELCKVIAEAASAAFPEAVKAVP